MELHPRIPVCSQREPLLRVKSAVTVQKNSTYEAGKKKEIINWVLCYLVSGESILVKSAVIPGRLQFLKRPPNDFYTPISGDVLVTWMVCNELVIYSFETSLMTSLSKNNSWGMYV